MFYSKLLPIIYNRTIWENSKYKFLRLFSTISSTHRQDKHQKRLEYLIQKAIRKSYKKVEKNPENNKLEELKSLLSDRDFKTINDSKGLVTVCVAKFAHTEEIAIEFEYRIRQEDELKLFDVIVSRGSQFPKLVFTCNSAPTFQLLSVRVIPVGVNYLCQDIYDGPNLSLLPKSMQNGLLQFLLDRGVDAKTAEFIEVYGHRKHVLERIAFLERLADFMKVDVDNPVSVPTR